MARAVTTTVKVINGFKIVNKYKDGTEKETSFYEGDLVDNLKYDRNKELIIASGIIDDVTIRHKKYATKTYVNKNSCIENDAVLESITFDYSEKNDSKVDTILARDLLEYNDDKEVIKVETKPDIKVKLSVLLSDETKTEMELTEGMFITNLVLQKPTGDYVGDYKLSSFLYEKAARDAKVVGMYLIGIDKELKIYFEDVKKCGSNGMIAKSEDNISDILNDLYTKDTASLMLSSGNYNVPLTLKKTVSVVGSKFDTSALVPSRAIDDVILNESTLTDVLTGEKGADITVSGVTITKSANIKINSAKSIKFKNCRFLDMVPDNAKSNLFYDTFDETNTEGVLLQVENCYFGTNNPGAAGNTYNLFELNSKLADGSYIKNCYFEKSVCTHNVINLYDVVDGATIEISGNYFAYSGNAIRIGFINEPNCTVNILNNKYLETDTDTDYEGLCFIQPYGKKTTSFKNVTINMTGNKYLGEGEVKDIYLYYGKNDTQITEELRPTVYVNKKLQESIFTPM